MAAGSSTAKGVAFDLPASTGCSWRASGSALSCAQKAMPVSSLVLSEVQATRTSPAGLTASETERALAGTFLKVAASGAPVGPVRTIRTFELSA